MSVNAILATDLDYGIGMEGDLPWPKNRRDMRWFSDNTKGHVVVMGRATWESLGNQNLPNRINVVISNSELGGQPHVQMSGDIEMILQHLEERYPDLDIWIMGGANIYHQALPYCDKLYLTTIRKQYKCDRYVESNIIVRFPVIEYWDEDDELTFQIRVKK
jgi:dihydrofolate reductase